MRKEVLVGANYYIVGEFANYITYKAPRISQPVYVYTAHPAGMFLALKVSYSTAERPVISS